MCLFGSVFGGLGTGTNYASGIEELCSAASFDLDAPTTDVLSVEASLLAVTNSIHTVVTPGYGDAA